ncbi:MAG: hypothetical protein GF398_05115 [Chitinivibrionales bacterium]|nr:hypothetical protein [Chitinivibrionales bacterium]
MRFKGVAFLICSTLCVQLSFAHGTQFYRLSHTGIVLQAEFDTKQPIAQAQVLLFAPGSSTPNDTTITDAHGRFFILPTRPGTWIAQVRGKGGHGMRINVNIDENMLAQVNKAEAGGITFMQKTIMAACVVWAAIVTALYVTQRKRT